MVLRRAPESRGPPKHQSARLRLQVPESGKMPDTCHAIPLHPRGPVLPPHQPSSFPYSRLLSLVTPSLRLA